MPILEGLEKAEFQEATVEQKQEEEEVSGAESTLSEAASDSVGPRLYLNFFI